MRKHTQTQFNAAPLLYSVVDAARMLGVSRSQGYKLFTAGKLTPKKLGERTLVAASELEAFAAGLEPAKPARTGRGV